jgi:glycosyltransferase involved in cell wall biosynthesis
MRIGINGAFWGMSGTGSGQYLHHLITNLMATEGDLVCFVPASVVQDTMPHGPLFKFVPTPFDQGISARHADLAKVWFEQLAFPRACVAQGIEVAHVPYFAPPLHPTCPMVVTIHDLIPLRLPEYAASRRARLYMRLVSRAARQATLILTDSHASARDIQELLRIPPERIRVIYLGVNRDGPVAYRPLPDEASLPVRQRLGLSRPYLLYLGGFDRRKRVPELLRAFADAERAISDVDLVIAGQLPAQDSAFAPDPRLLVRDLGLEARVRFVGWVPEEDKPALLSGARAFLFPSIYEGFGLPVLEALACGTPAVVASGSSLEEIAGQGALVVPPDDENALAKAMIQIAHDDLLRQEMAQAGLSQASAFSWLRTTQETLSAYREALSLGPIAALHNVGHDAPHSNLSARGQ